VEDGRREAVSFEAVGSVVDGEDLLAIAAVERSDSKSGPSVVFLRLPRFRAFSEADRVVISDPK
jgi:TPP-dependent pyruvate/acetoin dehydrogenase alpha subunit